MKQRPKFRGNEFTNDIEKDKISDEEVELMSKSFTSNVIPNRTNVIQLQEGDTLQALSIRYQCPIAELKRLNNLHKENEIFARRSIKVPYRHFAVPAVHKSGDNSPDKSIPKNSVDPTILEEKLSSISSTSNLQDSIIVPDSIDLRNNSPTENNFNQIIFNTTLIQKEERNNIEEDISDEEVDLLPNDFSEDKIRTEFSCSGDDWGLSWPILLGIILIVAFLGPLLYIIYIAEHPEKYHHHS